MKTAIITAETLRQYQQSHGAPNGRELRIGDTVQIRDDPHGELKRRLDLYRAGYIEVDRRDIDWHD